MAIGGFWNEFYKIASKRLKFCNKRRHGPLLPINQPRNQAAGCFDNKNRMMLKKINRTIGYDEYPGNTPPHTSNRVSKERESQNKKRMHPGLLNPATLARPCYNFVGHQVCV